MVSIRFQPRGLAYANTAPRMASVSYKHRHSSASTAQEQVSNRRFQQAYSLLIRQPQAAAFCFAPIFLMVSILSQHTFLNALHTDNQNTCINPFLPSILNGASQKKIHDSPCRPLAPQFFQVTLNANVVLVFSPGGSHTGAFGNNSAFHQRYFLFQKAGCNRTSCSGHGFDPPALFFGVRKVAKQRLLRRRRNGLEPCMERRR